MHAVSYYRGTYSALLFFCKEMDILTVHFYAYRDTGITGTKCPKGGARIALKVYTSSWGDFLSPYSGCYAYNWHMLSDLLTSFKPVSFDPPEL